MDLTGVEGKNIFRISGIRNIGISLYMSVNSRKSVELIAVLLTYCFIWGCGDYALINAGTKELAPKVDLGQTIGSVAEVLTVESIPVGGYGLAGNLKGTGSVECPPQVRAYLKRYILTQVSGNKIDIDKFINSPDTAVVWVEGIIPASASKNQKFDVKVTALSGTQTTSLEGGWLYGAELMARSRLVLTTKALATTQGPVFIDTIDTPKTDKKVGYILAGGTVLDEYKISVVLREADYRMTSRVRNRLNERFSDAEVKAVSSRRVELVVPAKYKGRKQNFVSIVKAMYLDYTPETTYERIMTFVRKLAVLDDKEASEIALEAIGNESVGKLATLLNSSNEEVRLRAARCMLNLGSDDGLEVLREIAMHKDSSYRVEALEAITIAARRNYAVSVCRDLLRDSDFNIRLATYEQLRKLDDISIARSHIGRSFYLEQLAQTEYKAIYVCRSGQPRIVLFGAPIYCRDNIFIQSNDGDITINASAGQRYISVMRKHPTRPIMIGPLRSSFSVGDIIQVLCEEPPKRGEQGFGGLGVSYADMIALLKQMCDKGAVRAEFRAGPPPKFD